MPDRYDADEVLEIVKRSVENMTSAANDCGLPDLVDAEAAYMGTTEYSPCDADSPAISIVGFARLRGDAIGESCPYTTTTGDMVVDVEIDTETNWALDADACSGDQEILEATLTHEFGHVFGLDDVRERAHGDLTMSSRSNGPCTTEEISLGLGDVLGLQELY